MAGTTREWVLLTRYDLQLWIGIVLFMALRNVQVRDTCCSPQSRIWQIADYMPLRRFEQIRRFIPIAAPPAAAAGADCEPSDARWFVKVSPLADLLKERFKTYAAMPTACSI